MIIQKFMHNAKSGLNNTANFTLVKTSTVMSIFKYNQKVI